MREENIYFTGFPLPMENVGGPDAAVVKEDLARRLCNLIPVACLRRVRSILLTWSLAKGFCKGARQHRTRAPLTVSFAVGGAGAQREIAVAAMKSLRREISRGMVRFNLIAGTRPEVAEYFRKAVMDAGLVAALGKGDVRVLSAVDRPAYFCAVHKDDARDGRAVDQAVGIVVLRGFGYSDYYGADRGESGRL